MKKTAKGSRPAPTAVPVTSLPAAAAVHQTPEFWMPLKIGLFTGLLMAALTFPAWQLRRFFGNPIDLLQTGILKTADITLLVVMPVLAGLVLGYLLFRNQATLKQSLAAIALAGFLQQVIIQIGETYTLAFFLIPFTATLVSAFVAKNALQGFRT